MSPVPLVSVIIPAYFSYETLPASLGSLMRQTYERFEVIVVDSTPVGELPAELTSAFPAVRFHRSPRRLLPHEARNHGAGMARGRFLVFTDPDCEAAPNWLATLVACHESGRPVVGGAVDATGSWWDRAVHASKFSWWLPGGPSGPRPEIPTANASYDREAWNAVGPFRGEHFAADAELSRRARESGREVWFEPKAVVKHDHQTVGVGEFFRERLARGRDHGAMRVALREWSRARCLAYLLLVPALPLLMLARALRFELAARQAGLALTTLPVQLAANITWCAGEAGAHWSAIWRRREDR